MDGARLKALPMSMRLKANATRSASNGRIVPRTSSTKKKGLDKPMSTLSIQSVRLEHLLLIQREQHALQPAEEGTEHRKDERRTNELSYKAPC